MAKMKVFELKKLLSDQYQVNVENKDIVTFLEKSMGIKKTHSSNLNDHEVKTVIEHYAPATVKASETPAAKTVQTVRPAIGQRPNVPGRRGTQGIRPETISQAKPQEQKTDEAAKKARAKKAEETAAKKAQEQKADTGAKKSREKTAEEAAADKASEQKAKEAAVKEKEKAAEKKAEEASKKKAQEKTMEHKAEEASSAKKDKEKTDEKKADEPAAVKIEAEKKPEPAAASQQTMKSYHAGGGQAPAQTKPESGQRGQTAPRQRPQGSGRPKQRQRPHSQRPDSHGQSRQQAHSDRTGQTARSGQPSGRQGGPQDRFAGQRPHGGQALYQKQQADQRTDRRSAFHPKDFDAFMKDEDEKPAYAGKHAKKGAQKGDKKSYDQPAYEQKAPEKSDRRNRDRLNKDKYSKDKIFQDSDDEFAMNKLASRKGQFIKPKPVVEQEEEIKVITLPETLTIKELADKMKMPAASLIKKLFLAGKVYTINQEISFEEAEEIALEYDIICEREVVVNEIEELLKDEEDDPATLVKRPPVVCVMGHVDHGKTSLLDAIRHTNVTAKEAGGITQHIGAYIVEINGEKITFLDTPGHEAFTSMRMRGAQATDIAILVVAADDGVMPQTVEAISHAKAAGVKIIVAINKIDKPSANIERVKQELTEYDLIAEDWGGDTIMVPVSAHTKEGLDQLLEMILLMAELEELKANPNRKARGLVIEAELDKGRGPVATILVQKGTLRVGDNVAVGSSYGKVRAMIDDKGRKVEEATPSTPVEILGLNSVPDVGEIFVATETEKEARTIAEAYIAQNKEKLLADTKKRLSLDGLFSEIKAGNIKELNLIIKADVQGSVEAMKQSVLKLSNEEVAVKVIHGGVGAVNESDVILASTCNGIIIGFNVKADVRAKEMAEQEKVDIRYYRVIYDAINDIEAAMKGLLDPVYEERITGHAEVRQIFKASSLGTIAGSYVTDGKIGRNHRVRIFRDNKLIHEGTLASLKRFQDDVKEVAAGYECGLIFDKFNDVRKDDKVEFYVLEEVPR
ncbi:MAG: translation initiation factor IF-2 [Clostridiales bacterium]|nr:translation initiation factor IF-2 [Clostridiales bacterium]